MVGSSLRGLFLTISYNVILRIYKNKKEKDYETFTNVLFNSEKEANDFGKKSMKRGFEHKVVEYNESNIDKYWYK